MKTFLLSSKLFYKNIFLVLAYCLFLGFVNYNFYQAFKGVLVYDQPSFLFLSETMGLSMFCSIFFMFFSYEFFIKLRAARLEECLKATGSGRIRLFLSQFIVIVILIIVIAVTTVAYNFAYPLIDLQNSEYIMHMLKSIFIYMFIVPLVAALLGACISMAFKRLKAYLLLILFSLLSSPIAAGIAFTVTDATNYTVDIFPFFDIFNIYPSNLEWSPNYMFGLTLLPYIIELLLFWIFAFIAVIIFKMSKNHRYTIKAICAVCAVVSLASLVLFLQPSSKFDMSMRPGSGRDSDLYYFYNQNFKPKEEVADFEVLGYDLDIDVNNQLNVSATLKVDKTELRTYKFTLYHRYKIKNVTDQDNASLNFNQDNDYVEVFSNEPLTEIVITYSGFNSRFYSNSQGIFLPGYFPYYPIPGYKKVYSVDRQCFNKLSLSNEADFNMTIKSQKPVYTNLDLNGDGIYSGKSNGLTIMSGFFKSVVSNGIEVVYPHFDTTEFTLAKIDQDIKTFLEIKKDDRTIKKIFIIPDVNLRNDSIAVYSDHMTTKQLLWLPEMYVYTKINDEKHSLYSLQDIYLNRKDTFEEILASEANYPPEFERTYTIYREKIGLLGEEAVIQKTNFYLYDGNDTRTVIEFLNQLK